LKSYPWRAENHGQVRMPGRISRMPLAYTPGGRL
jgi:hypothetical protein